MHLPTVDISADAIYGFYAGRHAQVRLKFHNMGATPYDWLLLESLLHNYTMWAQANLADGGTVYLSLIRPQGGGMVQGFLCRHQKYTLLPRILQDEVATYTMGQQWCFQKACRKCTTQSSMWTSKRRSKPCPRTLSTRDGALKSMFARCSRVRTHRRTDRPS